MIDPGHEGGVLLPDGRGEFGQFLFGLTRAFLLPFVGDAAGLFFDGMDIREAGAALGLPPPIKHRPERPGEATVITKQHRFSHPYRAPFPTPPQTQGCAPSSLAPGSVLPAFQACSACVGRRDLPSHEATARHARPLPCSLGLTGLA